MSVPQAHSDRSLSDVLEDIIANLRAMVRAEFRLAKAEVAEKADAATKPAIMLGTAALVGIYGCLFLLLSAVLALSMVVPSWAAALIVGGCLTVVGWGLATTGVKKLKNIRPIPDKTVKNLKEDVWATRHIK
jgi:uncharacterized membrane protein YqjE